MWFKNFYEIIHKHKNDDRYTVTSGTGNFYETAELARPDVDRLNRIAYGRQKEDFDKEEATANKYEAEYQALAAVGLRPARAAPAKRVFKLEDEYFLEAVPVAMAGEPPDEECSCQEFRRGEHTKFETNPLCPIHGEPPEEDSNG